MYQFNPVTGAVSTLANDTNGTDGLWVDTDAGVLYVGELLTGDVMRWNLRSSDTALQAAVRPVAGDVGSGGACALVCARV